MADTVEGRITVECKCGKRLKAPVSAAGKKAKCPGCGNVLVIEAPPPAHDDSLADIYSLAADAEQASTRAASGPSCPGCGSSIEPAAVLCTSCGFNLKTGKQTAMATASVPPVPPPPGKLSPLGAGKKKKIVDALAPQRSAWFGLLGCIGGGLVGALVWFLVAYFTGYELYFLAMVVGVCCGLGMQIGQRGYSTLGGVVSAFMTFLSVLLAKVAVVAAVLLPVATGSSNEIFGVDLRLIPSMTDEELRAMGIDPDEATEDQIEMAGDRAEKKIKAMSPAEREAKIAAIEDAETVETLVEYMTEEVLAEKKIEYEDATEEQTTAAETEAKKRVEAIPREKRKTELARLEKASEERMQAAMAKAKAEAEARKARGEADPDDLAGGGLSTGAKVGLFALFFSIFFGWKSLLFTILAMGLAYRTASGAVSG